MNEQQITITQKRIIDAALYLISKVGYKGTSTKLIAQTAGVNETTIFKNFKTKELLVNVAFRLYVKQIKLEIDSFFREKFNNIQDLIRRAGYFLQAIYEKYRYVVIASIKDIGSKKKEIIFTCIQEYMNAILSEKSQEFCEVDSFCEKDFETVIFIYNNAILALLLQEIKPNNEQKKCSITLENIIEMILRFF